MKKEVTAIFDIGKTNKKFFLFDEKLKEVYRVYTRFEEIEDEDGFPTENLAELSQWVKSTFQKARDLPEYKITSLNFSSYGASFVHLDEDLKPVAPLYNYLKPTDELFIQEFYDKYGPEGEFVKNTGSPRLGFLNSGFQLYWLKKKRPELFKKTKYALHLPQYLSFLFTNEVVSEYTSIGCHTALWDFERNNYHQWVYDEGIDSKLAPIVHTDHHFEKGNLKIGVGIHDSSAALLPYLHKNTEPFLLLSTGTWSICINPFATGTLSKKDIDEGCIFNQRIDGNPVKVSRLFLGKEYKTQAEYLSQQLNVAYELHKEVKFDREIFQSIQQKNEKYFRWEHLHPSQNHSLSKFNFNAYEVAYHQLIYELVQLQIEKVNVTIGDLKPTKLFIDGGFSDNEVFVKMLSIQLKEFEIIPSSEALGSALGAALLLNQKPTLK